MQSEEKQNVALPVLIGSVENHRIAWIDFETNGLKASFAMPLELGIIVTDVNLNELGRRSWLIDSRVGLTFEAMLSFDAYINTLHRNNGLLDDLQSAERSGELRRRFEVDDEALTWLRGFIPEGKILLAGSSVHFDKAFVSEHFPKLEANSNHRLVDVSGWQTTKNVIHGRNLKTGFEGVGGHRVFSDLENTLQRARAIWIEERQSAERLNHLATLVMALRSQYHDEPGFLQQAVESIVNKNGVFNDGRTWSCDGGGRITVAAGQ